MMDNFDINKFSEQLKQEAEKMQDRLKSTQDELTKLRVVGKANGGMVSVEMNGRHEVHSVKINPALEGEDFNMLGDLLAAAFNDAVKHVEKVSQEKIAQLTSGLNGMGGFMQDKDADK